MIKSFQSIGQIKNWQLARLMSFLVGVIFSITPFTLVAQTVAITQQQLQQINQKIKRTQQDLQTNLGQRRQAHQSLENAEKKLAVLQQQLADSKAQQTEQRRQLDYLIQQQMQLKNEKTKLLAQLAQQINRFYQLGPTPKLQLLLSQQDPLIRYRLEYYLRQLDQKRQQRLAELSQVDQQIKANQQKVDQKQRQLAQSIKAQQITRIELQQQHNQRRIALQDLQKKQQTNQQRLANLQHQRQINEQTLAQLEQEIIAARAKAKARANAEAAKHQLRPDELIAAPAQNTSKQYSMNRKMPGSSDKNSWPVQGQLIVNYGDGMGLSRNGILIQAPAGTAIHAAEAGQVVFADWLNGFGNLIILDHDNTLSVYAHNERNIVKTGQQVKQNQVIATVGDSGGSEQTALYFEVRQQGRPVNPLTWLKSSH